MKRTLTVSLTPVLLTACAHSGQPATAPPAQTLVTTLISEQVPLIQLAQNELAGVSQVPLTSRAAPSSGHTPSTAAVPGAPSPGSLTAGTHMLSASAPPASMQTLAPAGQAQSLRQAVTRIAPPDWKQRYGTGLMPDKREPLRWEGNAPWPQTLEKVLRPLGYTVATDPATRQVSVSPGAVAGKSQAGSSTAPRSPFGAASGRTAPVAVTPPVSWNITAGTTLRDALFSWAATARCEAPGIQNWTIAWSTQVNYRVDAPLHFTGSFRDALNGLFTLYGTAKVPLYAGVRPAQCVVVVDDREPR
ncbi:toxin co-regulated pilus biosynthesis Q family protein [Serratia marcescens]|uniref:toxin co-regulated pilus biosynthesis Q family protein n=1 Tax=Serratia marcescens TaxID=615 RepID=UPI0009B2A3B3|nr:toxin co-regulated pilus biosynthesis Q family protein [Serratia marcescens]